jgi:hypothetical protein
LSMFSFICCWTRKITNMRCFCIIKRCNRYRLSPSLSYLRKGFFKFTRAGIETVKRLETGFLPAWRQKWTGRMEKIRPVPTLASVSRDNLRTELILLNSNYHWREIVPVGLTWRYHASTIQTNSISHIISFTVESFEDVIFLLVFSWYVFVLDSKPFLVVQYHH